MTHFKQGVDQVDKCIDTILTSFMLRRFSVLLKYLALLENKVNPCTLDSISLAIILYARYKLHFLDRISGLPHYHITTKLIISL